MKKIITSVVLLSGVVAYAQQGKVGINTTSPTATLEITPTEENLGKNTNEGLLIPRLTKERVSKMESPVTSTLVYVSDVAYQSEDAKMSEVDAVGFYHYNGTKWVKHLDTDTNTGLWAQRESNGVTETYLVPANDNSDFVGYTSGRKYKLNLGNVDNTEFSENGGVLTSISSDVLSDTSESNLVLNRTNALLKQDYISRNSSVNYYGLGSFIKTSGVTSNFTEATGAVLSAEHLSTGKVNNVVGLYATGNVGSSTQTGANAGRVSSGVFVSRNYGISDNLDGIRSYSENYGTVNDTIRGMYLSTTSQIARNGSVPGHTISTMRGITNEVNLSENATLNTRIDGIITFVNIYSDINNALIRGTHSSVDISANKTVTGGDVTNFMSSFRLRERSSIRSYQEYGIYPNIDDNATIENYIGYSLSGGIVSSTSTIKNMYGIRLANINKGTENNYAIYTDAGAISFGDRVNIRNTRDISLETETAPFMIGSNTSFNLAMDNNEIMARNNGGATELFLQTDGGDLLINTNVAGQGTYFRSGNLGLAVSQPSEKLHVSGNALVTGTVTASRFMGTNGVTIFPDYVFEKYYKGTSTIKADYQFKTLSQVEEFVKTNGHLPGYQSAEVIKNQGYIDLMQTQLTNVEKIEELYLHTIEQDKALKEKDAKIQDLETRLQKIEALLVK